MLSDECAPFASGAWIKNFTLELAVVVPKLKLLLESAASAPDPVPAPTVGPAKASAVSCVAKEVARKYPTPIARTQKRKRSLNFFPEFIMN